MQFVEDVTRSLIIPLGFFETPKQPTITQKKKDKQVKKSYFWDQARFIPDIWAIVCTICILVLSSGALGTTGEAGTGAGAATSGCGILNAVWKKSRIEPTRIRFVVLPLPVGPLRSWRVRFRLWRKIPLRQVLSPTSWRNSGAVVFCDRSWAHGTFQQPSGRSFLAARGKKKAVVNSAARANNFSVDLQILLINCRYYLLHCFDIWRNIKLVGLNCTNNRVSNKKYVNSSFLVSR